MSCISLYCADCIDVLPSIPSKSIDLILCDLPYGITQNKWDSILPTHILWTQWKRLLKPKGNIVLTACQPFTSMLVMSNPSWFRYALVWEKTTVTGHLNAKKMPLRSHEDILVFSNKGAVYNPQKTTGHPRKVSSAEHKKNCIATTNYGRHAATGYDSTERYPRSVMKFASDKQKSSLHPTQKPVALFEWLIRTYSNDGATVLDHCAGSCTTGIACQRSNRSAVLVELDPAMVKLAALRLGINVTNNPKESPND